MGIRKSLSSKNRNHSTSDIAKLSKLTGHDLDGHTDCLNRIVDYYIRVFWHFTISGRAQQALGGPEPCQLPGPPSALHPALKTLVNNIQVVIRSLFLDVEFSVVRKFSKFFVHSIT